VLYGVNGTERGFRYHPSIGKQLIGMTAPSTAPTVSAEGASSAGFCVTSLTPLDADGEAVAFFSEVPLRFKNTPTLTSSGGGGTGATLTAALQGDTVGRLDVTDKGAGYYTAPTLTISGGGGSGAKAEASVVDGSVVSAYVSTMGTGYTTVPLVTVTAIAPTTTAKATGVLRSGYLSGVTLTDTGAQFGSKPSFAVSYKSDADASLSATLSNGFVDSITVTNGGSGYTAATVSISGGGASKNATATATVAAGAVTKITITDVGRDYTSAPTVTISGDGTAATATPTVYYGLTISIASAGDSYGFGNFDVSLASSQKLAFSGHTGPGPLSYSGAAAYTEQYVVNSTGGLVSVRTGAHRFLTAPTGVTVTRIASPTITAYENKGSADITLEQAFSGKYLCCYRFIDSTSASFGGPVPSDLSPFTEVDTGAGASSLTWTVSKASADTRATHVELWRTTSDQALTLYRIATIALTDFVSTTYSYTDTISDYALTLESRSGFAAMPIILPNGQVNARRFGIPPQNLSILCQFQDRMWYACDNTKAKPNSLYFSEIDEPESVPLVNEVVIQENSRGTDAVVALIPFGESLLVAQRRHLYQMSYNALPIVDARISVLGARGALNDRCWDTFGDVAAIADSSGIYTVSGGSITPISDPIKNYWQDGIIDLSKAELFSLVYDGTQSVLRFYHLATGDSGSAPTRALCFSLVTNTWWMETYNHTVTAEADIIHSGANTYAHATYDGVILRPAGVTDRGTAVPYSFKTGALALNKDADRSIRFVYTPTAGSETLSVAVEYNNSGTARGNAIVLTNYNGFEVSQGGAATLDLSSTRSALGAATGHARLRFSGRFDDNSVGTDRHIAISMSGSQTSHRVTVHGVAVGGVE
jgi:hypothetical protein